MYRVLIADDEQAVRIGMRSFIDWNQNGFELVGEAKDGKAAFALIQQTRPDIVIADLKMPEMDGVELIKNLNASGFRGKILVLSNYDEFNLVRNAMKAGASDYLLKVTMEPDELLNILKQLCEKLSSEKAVLEESNKIRLELDRSREIETRQYFAELINGTAPDDDCIKRAKALGINAGNGSKQLFYVVIDNFEETIESGKIKDVSRCSQTIVTLAADTLDFPDIYIIDLNHREFAILFLNCAERNIPELANRIQNTVSLYLNLSVTVAVSRVFSEMNEIKARYDSCKEACQYGFYCGCGDVIDEDAVKMSDDITCLEQKNAIAEIKQFIESNDQKAALEYFEKIIRNAEEAKVKPEVLKNTVSIIINDLFGLMIHYGIKDIMDLNQYKASLIQAETVEQFQNRLSSLLEILCVRLQQLKYGVYKKPIDQVIKFIDKHINQKISLNEIAKEVGMSEGYLCKTFKNETGKPLVQYVNDLKMNRAAELLKDPQIMVKEVSSAVGMDDQFYFNKMFKKYIGVSPSEYKKKQIPNPPYAIVVRSLNEEQYERRNNHHGKPILSRRSNSK